MAHLTQSQHRGETRWRICWNDSTKGKGKKGRRFSDCLARDHKEALDAFGASDYEREALAFGATSEKLRDRLLRCYKALERDKAKEAARAGGIGIGPRYDTPVLGLVDSWLAGIKADTKVREERGGRAGHAKTTAETYGDTVNKFRTFLKQRGKSDLTTGELTIDLLHEFKDHLIRAGAADGSSLAPPTVNRHLRQLRIVLHRYLHEGDPRPLVRVAVREIDRALSQTPTDRKLPQRYEPAQLRSLLEMALVLDARENRQHRGSIFARLAILLLTGCRKNEASALRWRDVDVMRRVVIIRAKKTGRERLLSLTSDPSGPVSPLLAELFTAWRDAAGGEAVDGAAFVLEGGGRHPKTAWDMFKNRTGGWFKTKGFRSSWVSYMMCMDRPKSVVALMAGHSLAVLEEHYFGMIHERLPGANLDECMGIKSILERGLDAAQAEARLRRSRS